MAAVPSIGRADRAVAQEAALTQALYQRHAPQIFRYCLHQLGSREEAEDAVQSTFLNAFRGVKRGIVPEHESAWLFKIAENVCLSRRRSTWRRGRIESPTDFGVVEELAPAPSRLADELVGLQGVLEQMPEGQRRAIHLREWQGLSYREIAAELQLSQTAVETLIFRARRSLAKGLEQPPAPVRKRAARGADLGNLVTGLKSLVIGGGAAAAKAGAVVAVVSAGTVVAASPATHHHARPPASSAPALVHADAHVASAATIPTVGPPQAGPDSRASQPAARRPVRVNARTDPAPPVVHSGHQPPPAPSSDAEPAARPPPDPPVTPAPPAAPPPVPTTPSAPSRAAARDNRSPASTGHGRGRGNKQVDPGTPPPPSGASSPPNGGGSDQGQGQSHHDGGAGHGH